MMLSSKSVALFLLGSCDSLMQAPFLNRRQPLRLHADYLSTLANGPPSPDPGQPEEMQSDLAETIIMIMNQKVDAQQATIEELRKDNAQLLAMMQELQESRERSRLNPPPEQALPQMPPPPQWQQNVSPPQMVTPQTEMPQSFAMNNPNPSSNIDQQSPQAARGQSMSLPSYSSEHALSAALQAANGQQPAGEQAYQQPWPTSSPMPYAPNSATTFYPSDAASIPSVESSPLPSLTTAVGPNNERFTVDFSGNFEANSVPPPPPPPPQPVYQQMAGSTAPPAPPAQQRFAVDAEGNMALAQPKYATDRQPIQARFAMDADGNFLLAQPSYHANNVGSSNRQTMQQPPQSGITDDRGNAPQGAPDARFMPPNYSAPPLQQPPGPSPASNSGLALREASPPPPRSAQTNYPRPLPSSGPVSGLPQPATLDFGQPTAYPRPMANYPGVPLPPDDDARKRMANAHSILVEYANKQNEQRRLAQSPPAENDQGK